MIDILAPHLIKFMRSFLISLTKHDNNQKHKFVFMFYDTNEMQTTTFTVHSGCQSEYLVRCEISSSECNCFHG